MKRMAVAVVFLAAVGVGLSCSRSSVSRPEGGAAPEASSISPELEDSPVEPSSPLVSVDDEMNHFFHRAGASPAALAPDLGTLVGEWRATIVAVDAEESPISVAGNTADAPPFSFTIKEQAGGYTLAPANPKGKPRSLAPDGDGYLAAAPGAPRLRLVPQGDELIGTLELKAPVQGRIEFHATRAH